MYEHMYGELLVEMDRLPPLHVRCAGQARGLRVVAFSCAMGSCGAMRSMPRNYTSFCTSPLRWEVPFKILEDAAIVVCV